MSSDQATEELLKSHPGLNRLLGWCGLATLALGYIATLLGQIFEVKRYLFEALGPDRLLSIHFGMAFGVAALFIIGYLILAVWVYRRYFLQLQPRKRRLFGGAVTVGGLLFAGCSIYAVLPPPPDVRELLDRESSLWEKELLGLGVRGGGIRASRADHSDEPQVWSTAQSLTGIMFNHWRPLSETDAKRIRDHLDYIDRVRIPKDEEGWGYMSDLDWGVTEIAGWVTLAYLASTQPNLVNLVWGRDSEKAFQRLEQYLKLLQGRQLTNGAWAPISQKDNLRFARTYSTTIAVWALIEAKKHPEMGKRIGSAYDEAVEGGIRWLLARYNDQVKSWVPNPERPKQTESFPGLTAQVLYVLERARPEFDFLLQANSSYQRALRAYMSSIAGADAASSLASRAATSNDRTPDSDVYLRPSKVILEGSTFLWFPWSLALCAQLSSKAMADPSTKRACNLLLGRINDLISFAHNDAVTYIMSESLFAIQLQVDQIIKSQVTKPVGKS